LPNESDADENSLAISPLFGDRISSSPSAFHVGARSAFEPFGNQDGHMNPTFHFWAHLIGVLTLETVIMVGVAASQERWLKSAAAQRTLWQIVFVSLGLITVAEWSGLGRTLASWTVGQLFTPRPSAYAVVGQREFKPEQGIPQPVNRRPPVSESGQSSRTPDGTRQTRNNPTMAVRDAAGPMSLKKTSVKPESTWWPGIAWLVGWIVLAARFGLGRVFLPIFFWRRPVTTDWTEPSEITKGDSMHNIKYFWKQSLAGIMILAAVDLPEVKSAAAETPPADHSSPAAAVPAMSTVQHSIGEKVVGIVGVQAADLEVLTARLFSVDEPTMMARMRQELGPSAGSSVLPQAFRKFLAHIEELQVPPSLVAYNPQASLLLIRARPSDHPVIERAIDALNGESSTERSRRPTVVGIASRANTSGTSATNRPSDVQAGSGPSSAPSGDTDQPVLYSRVFKVNPDTFLQALQSVQGFEAATSRAAFDLLRKPRQDFDRADSEPKQGSFIKSLEASIDPQSSTATAGARPLSPAVLRELENPIARFLEGLGMSPLTLITNGQGAAFVSVREDKANRAFFYKDRLGLFFVRATIAELDTVERGIQFLNCPPARLRPIKPELISPGP
jgi:hypothetical protein